MRTIILLSAIVIPVLFSVLSMLSKSKRLSALESFAVQHEFVFNKTKDYDLDNKLYNFELFQQGSSRYSVSFFGKGLQCGDFAFLMRSVSGTQTVWTRQRLSFCVFELPCALPSNLVIRPEGLLDGWFDIDFEAQEKFSDLFHVSSHNATFAQQFVTPQIMTILMKNPTSIDLENGWLLVAKNFDLWSMKEFRRNIDTGIALVQETKRFCEFV
jgi:hypothetical protein